jgi:hypothetical protein
MRLFGAGKLELELDRGDVTIAESERDGGVGWGAERGAWEEDQFKDGHKTILLFYLCELIAGRRRVARPRGVSTVIMPEWVAEAILSACEKVYGFEVESWDDVFGRPLKRGRRLNAERRNLKIKYRVHHRVSELNRAGRGLGKKLFDEVAKEFGINGTLVSELYYEAQREGIFPRDEDL